MAFRARRKSAVRQKKLQTMASENQNFCRSEIQSRMKKASSDSALMIRWTWTEKVSKPTVASRSYWRMLAPRRARASVATTSGCRPKRRYTMRRPVRATLVTNWVAMKTKSPMPAICQVTVSPGRR